jgi:hypothetical protein
LTSVSKNDILESESFAGKDLAMGRTVTLTIPSDWLKEDTLDQDTLRHALMLGLAQLEQEDTVDVGERTARVLLSTKHIHHLSASPVAQEGRDAQRQTPPVLPPPPVSEVLIAQRRGES